MNGEHRITVTIDGKEYPCYQTMGALLRFKQETGKDLTSANGGLSDSIVFLWCCTVSACKREGISFDMPLMDFADSIDIDEMNEWVSRIQQEKPTEPEEKKSL